ncbi:MAG: divergent polysaccharide deacetylase family protein [Nitrospirae bacterium]|nr:divergent polysaccharide deacetylase family protein [Nitrospirota bacterium]MBI4838216.1 divergent polysaccharide deacetylase family protein [Nitrospirota bacterium]
MASKGKGKPGTKKHHVLLILLLIAGVVFFLHKEASKESVQKDLSALFKTEPEPKPKAATLPRVAVVIDDLSSSRKKAEEIFKLSPALTLSVLPQETYTKWIAEEGHKLGHDIIGHIPMEAKEPHKLGRGGLYTWMSDDEILKTLQEDINSIPHIIGVSNHMGSAFTEDERTMKALLSGIKKQNLFFLDSLTTSKSAGAKTAGAHGIKLFKRDVFLDEKDAPEDIKAQWDKTVKIAKEKGYAVVLAHPRKNTIEFLKNVIRDNKEVMIVPLSEVTKP